jgi:hypothetical protein
MKKISFILLCLLVCAKAFAQTNKQAGQSTGESRMRLVIMDLQPKNISKVLSIAATDLLRSEIVDTGRFDVLERSQIDQILKEQSFQQTGCTENACAVQMGKLLSAKKVLLGEVNKLGAGTLITVRIVDVEKGIADYSMSEKAKSIDDIEYATKKLVNNLVLRITGRGRSVEETSAFAAYEKKKADEEKIEKKMRSPILRFGGNFGKGSDGFSSIPLQNELLTNANAMIDIMIYRMRNEEANGFDLFTRGGLQHRVTTEHTIAELYQAYGVLGSSDNQEMNQLDYWRTNLGIGVRYAYGFFALDTSIQGYAMGMVEYSTYSFSFLYSTATAENNYPMSATYTSFGALCGAGIEIGKNDFGIFIEFTYGYNSVGPKNLNLEKGKAYFGATWRTSYR